MVLKLMRHGERNPDKSLMDYGRQVTREKAKESGLKSEDLDAVKALGSNANPSEKTKMGRALETAHIYADEIAGDEAFESRANNWLNYENIKSPEPFSWTDEYNTHLPTNFKELTDKEKSVASKIAQTKTLIGFWE